MRQKRLLLDSPTPTPMTGRSRRCSIIRSKMLHKLSTMKSSFDSGASSTNSLMPDEIEHGVDGSINLKGAGDA